MNIGSESDDVEEIAARWVLQIDRGALDEAQQRELNAWLDADTRHLGAFVRAQAIWTDLDRVAALAAGRPPTPKAAAPSQLRRVAAVAVFGIAALTGLATLSDAYLAGRETTQVGEVRRLTLDDGSALALNTASVLQVKFDSQERRIVLRRGEASFQVADDDEQRPFVVQAGDVRVRALGTAFTVRMRSGHVDILVTDGIVEVRRTGEAAGAAIERVARNQKLVVTTAQEPLQAASVSEPEVVQRLAWQEGRLIFRGEELASAVEEVNRYSSLPIVIDDPGLGRKAFVGVFRLGDARAFAQAAATAFDAQVYEENGALHLRD